MTTMERTIPITADSPTKAGNSDNTWVVEILGADDLKLAEARQLAPYGRARLGVATRILMWAMRVYVLLSLILIVAQIYISLNPH